MKLKSMSKVVKKNEFVSIMLCIALVIILTLAGEVFWTGANLESLQVSIAPTAMMAFGMMFLLICGYFDMSMGSIMLLSGMCAAQLTLMGAPVPVIVLIVLIMGTVLGCVNGYLVSILGINALIATLGMQYIGYGLAMTLWNHMKANPGFAGFKYPETFIALGTTQIGGMYLMTWVMLILLAAFTFFLKFTTAGRKLYFVGGNKEASKLIGIHDKRILFLAYMATGLLSALAGTLLVARIQSPSQYMGDGMHMTCMIACVVGGGSFAGGKGSAVGAVFGVIFMSLLTNMFNLLEMKAQLQNVVVGLILIVVIVIDGYLNIRKMREQGKI